MGGQGKHSWASWLATHLQNPKVSPAMGSRDHQAPGLQETRRALASVLAVEVPLCDVCCGADATR